MLLSAACVVGLGTLAGAVVAELPALIAVAILGLALVALVNVAAIVGELRDALDD